MTFVNALTGHRQFVESIGDLSDPDRIPVVLLHGATQEGAVWRSTMQALDRAGYAPAAVDLPGHGKSERDPHDSRYDVERYAAEVIHLIRTLFDRPVIVVGHSLSSGVTLRMLLDAPPEIAGAVIVDGTSYSRGYTDEMLELVSIDPMQWLEINFRAICSRNSPPERVDEVAEGLGRCPESVAWNDMRAFAGLDLRPRLGEIEVPVAFLHGDEDWAITPEMAEETRGLIINAATRMTVLEGIGHFPHQEDPDRTNPALVDLVRWVASEACGGGQH